LNLPRTQEEIMKQLVVYIINVDEDVAEKAFNRSIDALALLNIIKFSPKTVSVEPHDDYRGIVARLNYTYVDDTADKNKNASKGLQDLIQSLIKAQLWNITTLKILIETGEIK
jgi:hypothetical protein